MRSYPLERRQRWGQLGAHLELTEGLKHRTTWFSALKAAGCSCTPISSPSWSLPCMTFSAFPKLQGHRVFLILCPLSMGVQQVFQLQSLVNPRPSEAASQLPGEVTYLLHGSSGEVICGLHFQKLVGPDSVLSHRFTRLKINTAL